MFKKTLSKKELIEAKSNFKNGQTGMILNQYELQGLSSKTRDYLSTHLQQCGNLYDLDDFAKCVDVTIDEIKIVPEEIILNHNEHLRGFIKAKEEFSKKKN